MSKNYGLVIPKVFPTGTFIQAMTQTQKATTNGGDNVITMSLTDDAEIMGARQKAFDFTVKNGTGGNSSAIGEVTITDGYGTPSVTTTQSVSDNGVDGTLTTTDIELHNLRGKKGDGIKTVTATIDNTIGEPTVTTALIEDDIIEGGKQQELQLNLSHLRGHDGDGISEVTATVDDSFGTPAAQVTDVTTAGDYGSTHHAINIAFHNIKGNGVVSIDKTGSQGLVDTYTITMTDGSTSTFDVCNGVSVASITKSGTEGLTDTYKITLTNGNETTFCVTNGAQGEQGIQGERGEQGIQGVQGIQGERGEPFSFARTFTSIANMNNSIGTADDVNEGQIVIIDTGNIEDAENACVYIRGATSYNYITDLSGATGMQGPQGVQGIQGVKGDKGDQGIQGYNGSNGRDGVSVYVGTTSTVGTGSISSGDVDRILIDPATGNIYKTVAKSNGGSVYREWQLQGNIKGADATLGTDWIQDNSAGIFIKAEQVSSGWGNSRYATLDLRGATNETSKAGTMIIGTNKNASNSAYPGLYIRGDTQNAALAGVKIFGNTGSTTQTAVEITGANCKKLEIKRDGLYWGGVKMWS